MTRSRPYQALVIGASAGGVEALTLLLPRLRRGCGVSVFVVVHLPRERPSLLARLFSDRCQLPVLEAEDKLPISPETIYFAPPDYHLLIDEGPALALDADELVHFSRPSIDVLFESAAAFYGSSALGCILTGANEDGATGLAAITKAGGGGLVQAPSTALVSTMPAAALREAVGSISLDLGAMGSCLEQLKAGELPLPPLSRMVP